MRKKHKYNLKRENKEKNKETFVLIFKRNISCKLHEDKYSYKLKTCIYIEREHEHSRVEHICATITKNNIQFK